MTWRNITIGQYQDIQKILSVQPEKGEELFQKIAILSVIYKKPEEFFDTPERISEYLGPLNVLLKSEPRGVLPIYFKCGGRKFKLNAHDMKSMLTQTYADLCLLTKDPTQITDNLHLIMATLCVERKGWFSNRAPLSFDDRAEHLRQHCPVSIAMTTALFFLEFAGGLRRDFAKLFGKGTGEDGEDTASGNEEGAESKWGWYATVFKMADGNPQIEEVYMNYPVVALLNRLAMMRDIKNEKP